MEFGPFFLGKRRWKNPPKNPQQNSHQNLGVLWPKSTLQGSGLDHLSQVPLCLQNWSFETPSRGPLPNPTPVSCTLRSSGVIWDVFTRYASQGEKDEEHDETTFSKKVAKMEY